MIRKTLEFSFYIFAAFALSRALLWIAPGDPIEILTSEMGYNISPDELSTRLGLNDGYFSSLSQRFFQLTRGDFGQTLLSREAILPLLISATTATLELALSAIIMTALIIVVILVAWSRSLFRVRFDQWIDVLTAVEWSFPMILLGPLLLYFFSVVVPLFEPQGSLILPAFALSLSMASYWVRTLVAKIRLPEAQALIASARSRGVSDFVSLHKYGIAPTLASLIPQITGQWGALLTGAIVAEAVFDYPGLGSLYLRSILQRDYLTFESVLFWNVCLILISHFIGELWSEAFDPRLRSP